MVKKIAGLFLVLSCRMVFTSGAFAISIPKWQPHDFEFKSKTIPDNPFTVNFSAEFAGPNGTKLVLPGFYDGNGIWKIRFSPTVEGNWQLTTVADIAGINNQKLRFTCIANPDKKVHGNLMVDPQNPHHFIYQDGTHWFPDGYECDWLWALDEHDNKLPVINSFLDKLSYYGFNFILINCYGYDTTWRPGKSSDDDYGPSALYPWNGSNDQPDFSHFNLTYWQHFDRMIDAMNKRGIIAHLYLKVYNKKVNWPKNGSPEDDRYYNWIIAHYAAYPNITWDLAKEANNEKSVDYKTGRLKFIRLTDPYHRLVTIHTDVQTYNSGAYNSLADFRSHQEQSNHLHASTLKQLAQNNWPVMNVESGYEHGPKGLLDKTYNNAESAEEDARRIWEIQMAGGYNAYYYTYTAWDVIRPNETPPGYAYLKNFKDFFTQTEYWLLKPADSLASTGYCLAHTGKEYVVFQNKSVPFTLNLTDLDKPLKARWYQPYTGNYMDAGTLQKGMVSLTPPEILGTGPVVLYIGGNTSLK